VLGLLAPLLLLLIEHKKHLISPTVVLSVWPTSIILVTDPKGAVGWILGVISILLNGLCYGVLGRLMVPLIHVTGEKSPYRK